MRLTACDATGAREEKGAVRKERLRPAMPGRRNTQVHCRRYACTPVSFLARSAPRARVDSGQSTQWRSSLRLGQRRWRVHESGRRMRGGVARAGTEGNPAPALRAGAEHVEVRTRSVAAAAAVCRVGDRGVRLRRGMKTLIMQRLGSWPGDTVCTGGGGLPRRGEQRHAWIRVRLSACASVPPLAVHRRKT